MLLLFWDCHSHSASPHILFFRASLLFPVFSPLILSFVVLNLLFKKPQCVLNFKYLYFQLLKYSLSQTPVFCWNYVSFNVFWEPFPLFSSILTKFAWKILILFDNSSNTPKYKFVDVLFPWLLVTLFYVLNWKWVILVILTLFAFFFRLFLYFLSYSCTDTFYKVKTMFYCYHRAIEGLFFIYCVF